jgi:hypothetical protein
MYYLVDGRRLPRFSLRLPFGKEVKEMPDGNVAEHYPGAVVHSQDGDYVPVCIECRAEKRGSGVCGNCGKDTANDVVIVG